MEGFLRVSIPEAHIRQNSMKIAEAIKNATTEQLVNELLERGFKWGYVFGHGTDEPAGSKDMVIADLEKTNVLIRPGDLFEKPEPISSYF